MMLLFVGCIDTLLMPMNDDDDGDDRDRSGGSADEDPRVDCGVNAEADGSQCVCVESYDWCDDDREDCCAWDARSYRITIHDVVIAPYNYDFYDMPWDWDGDIPDWLIDALELIGYAYQEAATAADVLQIIDEYAPELMEEYVPPDAFFEVYDAGADETLYASDTIDDSYEAPFRETFTLSSGEADGALLYFYDEDLSFDDDVQGFEFTTADLAWFSGRGEFTVTYWHNIFSITFEVEPRF
jgi:hypothetical protein